MSKLTTINEQLVMVELLNQEDITRLREQIHLQYKTASAKQKANLLARKIYEFIDDSLPNFSPEMKKTIRMELLNKQLQTKSLTITANDIVSSAIELMDADKAGQELTQWLQKKAEIDEATTKDYLEQFVKVDQPLAESSNLQADVIQLQETVDIPTKRWKKGLLLLGISVVLSLAFIAMSDFPLQKNRESAKEETLNLTEKTEAAKMVNELPTYLQYRKIDANKLRNWLHGRNSLLADEPYFSAIMNAADEFNLHPLLLFAITGQEQGFVSRGHERAAEIVNNPFNVFHSWEDFNTNITDSSRIAARTIVNLSKDRPEDTDPIQWINRKYAEDENWWIGVSQIYAQLESAVK